jgi:hypothetical protein
LSELLLKGLSPKRELDLESLLLGEDFDLSSPSKKFEKLPSVPPLLNPLFLSDLKLPPPEPVLLGLLGLSLLPFLLLKLPLLELSLPFIIKKCGAR